MAKVSIKAKTFVRGGGGHMFGKQSAGTQKPGQTATMGSGGGKFASGGKTKMFGKQSVGASRAC